MSNGNKKEEEKEGAKASPFSIISMLPGIAGDIAKIASSPEKKALREMQAGRGAGTAALRGLGSQMAREQISAAATGRGATRGLGLIGASERANQAIANVAPAMGMTAAREQAHATQMLRQNRAAQIASAANLGWKLTGGIGGAIANMVAAKDQLGYQGQEILPEQQDVLGIDRETGLSTTEPEVSQGPGTQQAPGAVEEMAQRGEVLPGAGVSPLPTREDYLFPGEGEIMQQMGATPDAVPAQTPAEEQVERERGAEARREMNRAQMEADKAIIKATSSAIEPAPDAPLGTAVLVPDQPPAPLDNEGIAEWAWGKYRDGDMDFQQLQEILTTFELPLEPPASMNWSGGSNAQ